MPVGVAVGLAGASSLAGGILGGQAARAGQEAAAGELAAARSSLMNIAIPDIEAQKLQYEMPELKYLQNYMETPEELARSEMENIQVSQDLRQAQVNALNKLAQVGEQGLTDQDRAALNSVRRDVAAQEQAREAAIMQDLATRGAAGGGLELAAKLKSSQGAADRASQQSDQLAAMAFQRALEATTQGGQLAGQVRGQEFGEQSAVAQAQDIVNRFNTQNRQEIGQRNIERQNLEQANRQRLEELGVALRNQQQERNKALAQQEFQNRMARAGATSGLSQQSAQLAQQAGQAQAGMYSGIGQGLGQVIMGGFNSLNKDKPAPLKP